MGFFDQIHASNWKLKMEIRCEACVIEQYKEGVHSRPHSEGSNEKRRKRAGTGKACRREKGRKCVGV